MGSKGLTEKDRCIETPNDALIAGKPLNKEDLTNARVDINVLRSKLQETQNKELKKNLSILLMLIISLAILGVYLSL